ncbi:MAG TPA: PHP domain-containing protein, partial [Bacillota bacterium]|nr:PHP domain-containing protein [Bacillota bacterium]
MGFDLHIHSIYSDGTLTPAQLVAEAVAKGLDGMALTDHDTIDGLPEVLEAGKGQNLRVIPGIELTTDFGKIEAHILGYNLDYHQPALVSKLEVILEARVGRVHEMIKRLNHRRIVLSWDEVKAMTNSRFVGRSHVFKAMEHRGLIDPMRRRDAFEYYLGKDGVAYVPHREIETREAIELITSAGGVPVLAHPGRVGADPYIKQLVDYGLRGVEVYYPTHTPELVKRYLRIAREYG